MNTGQRSHPVPIAVFELRRSSPTKPRVASNASAPWVVMRNNRANLEEVLQEADTLRSLVTVSGSPSWRHRVGGVEPPVEPRWGSRRLRFAHPGCARVARDPGLCWITPLEQRRRSRNRFRTRDLAQNDETL